MAMATIDCQVHNQCNSVWFASAVAVAATQCSSVCWMPNCNCNGICSCSCKLLLLWQQKAAKSALANCSLVFISMISWLWPCNAAQIADALNLGHLIAGVATEEEVFRVQTGRGRSPFGVQSRASCNLISTSFRANADAVCLCSDHGITLVLTLFSKMLNKCWNSIITSFL